MNRMRVAASSRDASLRAQQRKLADALIAPDSAEEEHAAELARKPATKAPAARIRWPRSSPRATAPMPTPATTSPTPRSRPRPEESRKTEE